MSNGLRNGVTLSLFWSVIAGLALVGGWVVDRQDRQHTRELEVVRKTQENMRKEWLDEVKGIRSDFRMILGRLPAAETK